jgi:hypothetical protein
MPPCGNGVRPKCYPFAAEIRRAPMSLVSKRSMPLDLIHGWRPVRVKKASHQNMERRFDRVETVKALGMIQQVQVRQQMHGEIAAKRSVAVTAVTTDSGHLDRALIEHDIVALMSVGC